MYKKVWCTCKVVVLRNKPTVFLTSSLPLPASLLKLPTVLCWGASCISATMYALLKFVLFQGDIVALKKLKMEREKEGFPITSLREINTLLKAQHPNIVTVRVSTLLMPLWFVIFSVSSVIVLLFFSLTITLYPGVVPLSSCPFSHHMMFLPKGMVEVKQTTFLCHCFINLLKWPIIYQQIGSDACDN